MKLYYSPGACSMAPHIVANEAGLPLSLVKVDLAAHKTEDGRDYYAVNPRGYVPALEFDDGAIHTEASALIQHLADQAPASGLMPAFGTPERLRILEWIAFVSTELHKGFGPLWAKDSPESVKESARQKLAKRFADVDKALAGKSFLGGETFTAADAYAFTVLNWANFHKLDMTPFANIKAFMARVAARPKVQQALREEGLA